MIKGQTNELKNLKNEDELLKEIQQYFENTRNQACIKINIRELNNNKNKLYK